MYVGARRGRKREMTSFIHLEELLERVENDRELMRELLSIFKEEFPQRFRALREAVESLDAPRVVLESHTLNGMLSNLAAREAAEAAANLESLARNGETAKFGESFARLDEIAHTLSRQVDSCMAEVSG
jgi:two-component system, sensor histidine kinase and response regulator